jgi:hypothetical protein
LDKEPQELQALSQRILVKAAGKLGGASELAKYLGIGDATLGEWIAGKSVPPSETILKAVSVMVENGATPQRNLSTQSGGRRPEGH